MLHPYTVPEIRRVIAVLQDIFDLVRVVDPIYTTEMELNARHDAEKAIDHSCYAVWQGKSERCANCISMLALQEGRRQSKYEFIGRDVFYVVAMPVAVDGQPLVLEIVSKVNDSVLLTAYGQNEFIQRITSFNESLHIDESTGLYNRRYCEEKLFLLRGKARLNKTDVSVVMAELPDLEQIALHYGAQVAEEALVAVGRLLSANVSRRRGDFVCRYSNTAFAIVLDNIPQSLLRQRMSELCARVGTLRLRGYEDIRLNVAMGVFSLSESPDATVELMVGNATRRLRAARAGDNVVFED